MIGMGLTIISAILFGSVAVLAKVLLASAGPATVGALTFLGAGLVGLIASMTSPAPLRPISSTRQGHLVFITALVLGAIIAPLLLMTGLQWTTASLASVLTNIEGIATASLAWLLFREKTNVTSIVGVIAILAGVLFFTTVEIVGMTGSIGPFLVGTAYLCWAIDINLMHHTPGIRATQATAIRGIAGALVMASVAWCRQEALPGGAVLGECLLVGVVGFGLSFILILRALPLIGTAKVGAISASAPVFSYLCSSIIERNALELSTPRLIAMTLIVLGIVAAGADAFVHNPGLHNEAPS